MDSSLPSPPAAAAEHPIPPPRPPVTSPISSRSEPPVSSPYHSPAWEAEDPTPIPRPPRPLSSPTPVAAERPIPPSLHPAVRPPLSGRSEPPVSSSYHSPTWEAEDPTPIPRPPRPISSPTPSAEHSIPRPPRPLSLPTPAAEHSIPRPPLPVSSPTPAAEHSIPRPPRPVSSPTSAEEHPIPPSPHRIDPPVSSPLWREPSPSPVENPTPTPRRTLPLVHQLIKPSPVSSPLRPPPPPPAAFLALPPPEKEAVAATAATAGHRLLREELGAETKEEGRGETGRVWSGPVDGREGWAVGEGKGQKRPVGKAAVAVGLRFSAMALSLVAFSVMAADRTVGWAGDSFDRYKEYRYLVSINVIAFVYSGFQVYAYVHYLITGKYILGRPVEYFFSFTMDQLLAYLLISASSSAATRTDAWVIMFGSDEFTNKASGSIAISFLAFLALALSSLISSYNLFRRNAK